ncbi:MAG: T9SS type A sorting domain-containing protein [Owenweeksia sp.]|nr:T9SS type A sorting domain-containing protein [Owenweeksia sp.]
MKYLLCFFLQLNLITLSLGQSFSEKILASDQDDISQGGISIGEDVFFLKAVDQNYFDQVGINQKIFKSDAYLNLSDSLEIARLLGWEKSGINTMEVESDSTFIALANVRRDSQNLAYRLRIDTALNILDSFVVANPIDTFLFWKKSFEVGTNYLFLGGKAYGGLIYPFYEVRSKATGQRQMETVFDSSAHSLIFDALKVGTDYMYVSTGRTEMGLIDSNFELSEKNTQPLFDSAHGYLFYKLYRAGKNTAYAFGSANQKIFGSAKVDTNLSLTQKDTFSIFNDQMSVFGAETFARGGANSFFMAASQDPVPLPSLLQPGLERNIVVYHTDSLGNVKWFRELGNGHYYLTTNIIATDDGGVLIFSVKYDSATYATNKTDLSIIKLDAMGNIEPLSHEKYNLKNEGLFSIYPNPADAYLLMDGITDQQPTITAEVIDLRGAVVLPAQEFGGNKLDISKLDPGHYLLKVVQDGKLLGLRKFVKH